ncbi:molybdopterin oxidoreductase family protein [Psychrosphaera algicola]|uniref:molybdopterin oxidoreductase family protein n=1 Tax=Psychrosphaera algicola TaxID=3023714 RepID=UPI002FEE4E2D
MGFEDAFTYQHPAEIFVEHAGLSGYKNGSESYAVRDFDISGLASLSEAEYDALQPVQWPVNTRYPNGCQHIFADNTFYTPSGKANFVAVEAKLPQQKASALYPYGVNSGRVRDHWHTMTRTGKSASLAKHTKEPFIAMHSTDLTKEGLTDGNLVKVTSEFGEVLVPVKVDDGLKVGQLFTPIHWNKLSAPTANIAKLYGSFVDPISGQPESKFTVANIEKAPVGQFMQLFCLEEMLIESDYWAKNTIQSGFEYACATANKIEGPMFWSRDLTAIEGNWSYFENSQSGIATALCIKDNRLVFVGFFAQYKTEINSDWVDSLFQQEEVSAEQINRVLRAVPVALILSTAKRYVAVIKSAKIKLSTR